MPLQIAILVQKVRNNFRLLVKTSWNHFVERKLKETEIRYSRVFYVANHSYNTVIYHNILENIKTQMRVNKKTTLYRLMRYV